MNLIRGAARLRKQCVKVTLGDNISELVEGMFRLLLAHKARGLAANQVGSDKRVIMLMLLGGPKCMVNPELIVSRGAVVTTEECLSLPGVSVEVTRPKSIRISWYDSKWVRYTEEIQFPDSAVICHEIDHLDGILITDRQA